MAEGARGVPQDRPIRLRIGINLGDSIIEDNEVYGRRRERAARLEALAEPGGICASRTVRNDVQDKLALAFEDLGERTPQEHPAPGARVSRRCGCTRERIPWLIFMSVHPRYGRLRGDPRFHELRRKIGFTKAQIDAPDTLAGERG